MLFNFECNSLADFVPLLLFALLTATVHDCNLLRVGAECVGVHVEKSNRSG